MKRRGFFRTLFGTVVATVAAPLIPAAVKPVSPFASGYIYCPYIPIIQGSVPNLNTVEFKPKKIHNRY